MQRQVSQSYRAKPRKQPRINERRIYTFYTKQCWDLWIDALPPEGAWDWTKEQWRLWAESWDQYDRQVAAVRNRASGPTPGQPASGQPTPGQPASGQPERASGASASSSHMEPLDVAVLTGINAKSRGQMRSLLRSEHRTLGLPRGRTTSIAKDMPPPPLCNRVVGDWKSPVQPCQCNLWPAWKDKTMQAGLRSQIMEYLDSNGTITYTGQDQCYYRPGKRNKRWWYDAIVNHSIKVLFPSGKWENVVAVN